MHLKQNIILAASRMAKVSVADMTGPGHDQRSYRPRALAMFYLHTLTKRSLPEIGRAFNRDHTTALSAIRKMKREKADDPVAWAQMEARFYAVYAVVVAERVKRQGENKEEWGSVTVKTIDGKPLSPLHTDTQEPEEPCSPSLNVQQPS